MILALKVPSVVPCEIGSTSKCDYTFLKLQIIKYTDCFKETQRECVIILTTFTTQLLSSWEFQSNHSTLLFLEQ